MNARKCIVGAVLVALLMWGPIDRSWPAWLLIRTAYLVLIPLAVWFALEFIWKRWQPDTASENRLNRALAGAAAGMLVVFAVLKAQDDFHMECTEWAPTHDGQECVGDDVPVPGADWGAVAMLVLAAGVAFWVCVRPQDPS